MDNPYFLPEQTLSEKKYIYGTYLEMAFHNFYITIEHIYKSVLKEDLDSALKRYYELKNWNFSEDILQDFAFANRWNAAFYFLKNSLPEERMKARDLLGKHFPFLVPMIDSDIKYKAKKNRNSPNAQNAEEPVETTTNAEEVMPESYYDYSYKVLFRLFVIMRELRNNYSHYFFLPYENQIEDFQKNEYPTIRGLKNVYDGAKRIINKRFPNMNMECSARFEMREDEELSKKLHRSILKPYELRNFIYKIDVFDHIQKKSHFSQFGLLMFIGLFLEKKYLHLFEDQIKLILPADRKAMEEIITCYRLRLPVRKLDVKKNSMALGLDMLNEMRRCPKELYDIIEDDKKDSFRVAAGENCDEDNSVLLLRNNDRFAYFVLRYIDELKLLDTCKDENDEPIKMRFQVSLGNYNYKFYDKTCIDSQTDKRVRSLVKELNGFGSLDEIENARNELWKDSIRRFEDVCPNTADSKPYVTDHHASYVFHSNRVGILVMPKGNDIYLPVLNGKETECLPPHCWLSIFDMPALVLLLKLNKERPASIILNYLGAYNELFHDISDGTLSPCADIRERIKEEYGISFENIPENMQEYLLRIKTNIQTKYAKSAKELLNKLIKETEYKKNKLEDNEKILKNPDNNKIGKKGYIQIKPGHLADFIAHDLMRFMPKEASKLTGLNFRVLQANIANYNDGNIDTLKRIFISAHIIGNEDNTLDHPFLMKVINKQLENTVALYKEYLNERLNYLQSLDNDNLYSAPFLYPERKKWADRTDDFYKKQALRYLEDEYCNKKVYKSIELPKGLFDEALREELVNLGNEELTRLALDVEKNNISWLIQSYFRLICDDDAPSYYNYKRNYPIFDEIAMNKPQDPKEYKDSKQTDLFMSDLKNLRDIRIKKVWLSKKNKEKCPNDFNYEDRGPKWTCQHNTTCTYKTDKKCILLETKKKEEEEKLRIQSRNFIKTQKLIRRYKLQDMIVWGMMQDLLFDDTQEANKKGKLGKLEALKLKDVKNENMLDKRIDFSVEIGNDGVKKTISQSDLRLKDYTTFYRILSDRRLPSLLSLINQDVIKKTEIDKEFDNFDDVHPDVLKKVFEVERLYKVATGRDDFFKFYEALSGITTLSNEEVKDLTNVRNSFAHMFYSDRLKISASSELPEKAKNIKEEFEKQIDNNKKH